MGNNSPRTLGATHTGRYTHWALRTALRDLRQPAAVGRGNNSGLKKKKFLLEANTGEQQSVGLKMVFVGRRILGNNSQWAENGFFIEG